MTTTASAFYTDYFSAYKYSNKIGDIVALIIFIIFARVFTYLALEYVNHAKR